MNSHKKYRSDFSHLALLLTIFLAARILFIIFMPHTYSKDLYAWLQVIDLLKQGKNPYTDSGVLNWPPFWMQILFAIHKVSDLTSISAITLIQIVLITTEALTLILTWWMLKRFFKYKNIFKLLVIAWALNPVAIVLNCQHCNFDIFVGLWILLSIAMILKFYEDHSPVNLLISCSFLGIGVLTKTVPLILAPLVLAAFKKQNKTAIVFGLSLILSPVVLGMSIIYTLAPIGVMRDVIGYRSIAGWYGITGVLSLFELYKTADFYTGISPMIFLILMFSSAWYALKNYPLNPDQFIKLSLLLLIAVPTFGPGFSPPYILWFFPLLMILYSISTRKTRIFLITGFIIIVATYLLEYALYEGHGAFLTKIIHDPTLLNMGQILGGHTQSVLIRLPMFIWHIILFIVLVLDLHRNRQLTSSLINEIN